MANDHGLGSASERSSLPALVDRVISDYLVSDRHEHEVRALCADIFRLGCAIGRSEAIKEYEAGQVKLEQQIRELRHEIDDLTRMDGER